MRPPSRVMESARRLLARAADERAVPRLTPRVAGVASLLIYAGLGLPAGAVAPYRELVVLPILVAIVLPPLWAMAVGGSALFLAAGSILSRPADPDSVVFLTELAVLAGVSVGLRLLLIERSSGAEAREAREAARAAGDVAVAEAARAATLDARMATVLELAGRLGRTLDRAAILATIVDELQRELGADLVTLRLVDGDVFKSEAWAGIPDEVGRALPPIRRDAVWLAEALRTAQPLVLDTTAAIPAAAERYEAHPGAPSIGAAILVPMLQEGQVSGLLSAAMHGPRHWTPDDTSLAAAVAGHAAIALHSAAMYERTEAWAAQLAVIQAASARMNRENTVESVGRAIVEEIRRIVDYHNCRVYQLQREDELVPIAFAGRVGAYEKVEWDALRTRVGEGFTGWVAEHRVPLLVPDASADPRGMNIPGTDDVDESMVVAPMCYEDHLIGVITLSKLGLHQFDDTHVRLLTILADQAATAVESARLLDRSTGLGQELGRLHAMGSELAQTLDPRQVADLIARHLAGALGVERCAISYWDQAADDLLTWGYHPVARRENVEPVYHLAHFPETRRVLREQAAVTVDVTDPAADPAEAAVLRAGGDAAALMLPLVAKGESIGLVELVSIRPITIDGARLEFIRTMANEAAMALENARLYESARTLADRDQLTGFYNHRYLHERLGEEIVRAQRSRRSLALLMVDLDDFKLVNDTFGHLFGDRVLAWTADVIRSALRASDVATRYGGDEFAILLPETNEAEAAVVADRVVEALLGRPYEVEGRRPLPIGASIGAAVFPADGRTAQDLIARADAALYRVKRAAVASASSGTGASRARAQPSRTRRRVAGPQVGREAEGAR